MLLLLRVRGATKPPPPPHKKQINKGAGCGACFEYFLRVRAEFTHSLHARHPGHPWPKRTHHKQNTGSFQAASGIVKPHVEQTLSDPCETH